jgi:hypothetical protein
VPSCPDSYDLSGGFTLPGFVQIMEIETSRIDELEALTDKMREERGDALLASEATVPEDRDQKGC